MVHQEEYHSCVTTGQWHRQVTLPDGDKVMIHSPRAIIHYVGTGLEGEFPTAVSVNVSVIFSFAFICIFVHSYWCEVTFFSLVLAFVFWYFWSKYAVPCHNDAYCYLVAAAASVYSSF